MRIAQNETLTSLQCHMLNFVYRMNLRDRNALWPSGKIGNFGPCDKMLILTPNFLYIIFLLYIFTLALIQIFLSCMLHMLFNITPVGVYFFFTVSVHPLLHGTCGSCFIHSLPAHLSGHLLLLQVMDSMWFSCLSYKILTTWKFSCSCSNWFHNAHYNINEWLTWCRCWYSVRILGWFIICGSFALEGSIILPLSSVNQAGTQMASPPAVSLLIVSSTLVSVLFAVRRTFILPSSTPAEWIWQF